ncbi:MAG: helix-turn-helix domain-containing protein [Candidatus Nanopelagicales bacterium]
MQAVRSTAAVGAVARAARIRLGWSQQQAADQAGVSRRFVNMLEGGEHRNAELWRVLALLEALGVELLTAGSDGSAGGTTEASPTSSGGDGFDLDRHLSGFRKGSPP